MEDTETILISQLIVKAGESKSLAFEALASAKTGNFEEADSLMKQANEASRQAHEFHMELLQKDIAGTTFKNPMLLMHSEDHLMSSLLARELIQELIENQKQIQSILNK